MSEALNDTEEWRDIPGYEGVYQASDMGRVRRILKRGPAKKCLKPGHNKKGYPHVSLCRGGVVRCFDVHTLVLMAFAGPRPDGMEACHRYGHPADNRLSNLRWGTHAANVMDARISMAKSGRTFGRPPTLAWSAVKAIRASSDSGVVLATQYGVSQGLISNIRTRRTRTQSAGAVLAARLT